MSERCPFCFEDFRRGEGAFRCTSNDPVRCPALPDEALGAFQRSPAPLMPPVTVVSNPYALRKAPTGTDCHQCGRRTTKALCPRCHNALPTQFLRTGGKSLAVVGAKESGKSHYVGVLVNQLMHSVLGRFGGSINPADEHTKARYARDFRSILYEDMRLLPATQSAAVDQALHLPMIFRVQVGAKRPKTAQMIFFDTAGEDFENLSVLEAEARYIARTDATLVLLDPLQIPAVRDMLGPSVELPNVTTDPLDLLSRVTDLIREGDNIPPDKRIKRPLALAFSKVDAIRDLIGGSPVLTSPPHSGKFDDGIAEDINISMHAYVRDWIGDALEGYVQQNWETHRYFGLSALGRPPIGGRLDGGISPLRVEDPVLWFLAEWDVIPRGGS